MSLEPAINEVATVNLTVPVMDEEQLAMLQMVDQEEGEGGSLLGELFEMFESESGQRLEDLGSICARNDLEELRRIIHFVVGSASNIGLLRLSSYYRDIEQAIDTKQLADSAGAEVPILEAFKDSCNYFRENHL
jgi:HPt (histidine-containing phosphotransfer) domain-containing protein